MLWLTALPLIDPNRATDYGLIAALPVQFFVAVGLVCVSFALSLRHRSAPTALLAANVVLLILIVQGTLPLIYDAPHYAWVYKHLGVVDFISQHGGVDRTIDIYHNWPGFFLLNAAFLGAAGMATSLTYVAWAQAFFNLLYLLVLLFVFRSLTADRRLVWLGTFLFFLGNWVGQDYFAPQAFGFLGYLVIVGICLRWLQPSAPPAPGRMHRRLPDRWVRWAHRWWAW